MHGQLVLGHYDYDVLAAAHRIRTAMSAAAAMAASDRPQPDLGRRRQIERRGEIDLVLTPRSSSTGRQRGSA